MITSIAIVSEGGNVTLLVNRLGRDGWNVQRYYNLTSHVRQSRLYRIIRACTLKPSTLFTSTQLVVTYYP